MNALLVGPRDAGPSTADLDIGFFDSDEEVAAHGPQACAPTCNSGLTFVCDGDSAHTCSSGRTFICDG
ncbi:hypothetical protein [Actinomadura verrucosospora]|uniref:Uncharacterized protein n=1 Tax=Actinomadura verrucosospora TaxID=46165 RepID=A0A7D3VYY2_ACTVE|nr:hypothetical protein [Actinomadura verrucosospora]QKG27275.1 hypothetical protein ACTIVE_8930 [Actinomadura verrucosospora]